MGLKGEWTGVRVTSSSSGGHTAGEGCLCINGNLERKGGWGSLDGPPRSRNRAVTPVRGKQVAWAPFELRLSKERRSVGRQLPHLGEERHEATRGGSAEPSDRSLRGEAGVARGTCSYLPRGTAAGNPERWKNFTASPPLIFPSLSSSAILNHLSRGTGFPCPCWIRQCAEGAKRVYCCALSEPQGVVARPLKLDLFAACPPAPGILYPGACGSSKGKLS